MSVINTMLKELDKRQQSHTLDNMQVEPVQYQVSIYSKTPWVLLIIVSFLLLLGVGYGWSNIIKNVVNQQVKLKQVLTSLVLTDPVEEESHNLVDIRTQVVDIPAPPVSNVRNATPGKTYDFCNLNHQGSPHWHRPSLKIRSISC